MLTKCLELQLCFSLLPWIVASHGRYLFHLTNSAEVYFLYNDSLYNVIDIICSSPQVPCLKVNKRRGLVVPMMGFMNLEGSGWGDAILY